MEPMYSRINEIVVKIFSDVLYIEEETLKRSSFNNVTMNELHVINAIGLSPNKTMSEIAKSLHITVGTLTSSINNLVKKDFATRYKDDNDRRLVYIGLTNNGKLLYRLHDKFHKTMVLKVVENLEDYEKTNLCELLEKLSEFLFEFEKEIIEKELR